MGEVKRRKRLLSNKWILVLKIVSACALLFVSAFFFFEHLEEFWSDISSFNPAPLFFFAGVIFVCYYIGYLVSRIEDKNFHRSERYDKIYKMIFSFTLAYIAIRAIFIEPFVCVPTYSLSAAVVIGVVNWFIPSIVMNDADDF